MLLSNLNTSPEERDVQIKLFRHSIVEFPLPVNPVNTLSVYSHGNRRLAY